MRRSEKDNQISKSVELLRKHGRKTKWPQESLAFRSSFTMAVNKLVSKTTRSVTCEMRAQLPTKRKPPATSRNQNTAQTQNDTTEIAIRQRVETNERCSQEKHII